MKEENTVNAPVMKMALRKSGIHVKDMFHKKIVAEVIGNIIESDQQGHQANSSHCNNFCDTKQKKSSIHNLSNDFRNYSTSLSSPVSLITDPV